MKHVYDTLLALAATTKKNEKQQILRDNDTTQLQQALHLALDPFTLYGFKKLPEHLESGDGDFNDGTLQLLIALHHKELTGNAAKAAVSEELSRLAPEDREVFKRILLKDLRAGIDAKSVNSVFPRLVPTFSAMLAEPFDAARVKAWPVMVQPKLDGVRVLVFVDPIKGTAKFLSRSGKEFTSFDDLAEPSVALARRLYGPSFPDGGIVLDGEVVTSDFLSTVSEVRRKNKTSENAVLHVFDAVPESLYRGYSHHLVSQVTRHEILQAGVSQIDTDRIRMIHNSFAHSTEEVYEAYERVRDQGGEGVIVKDMSAPYECRRTYSWMKIKDCQSVDVPIVDVERGTGKYADCAGAVVIEFEGVRVSIGSGLTDALRQDLWNLHQTSPDEVLGRIVEVEYHEETAYGSLRHPRFVRFRDSLTGDKE